MKYIKFVAVIATALLTVTAVAQVPTTSNSGNTSDHRSGAALAGGSTGIDIPVPQATSVKVDVYSDVMPNDKVSATFGPFRDQVIDFLRGLTKIGDLPTSRTSPSTFALANVFSVNDIMASDTAPLYNGVLNPTANGEQRGSRVGFPVRIVSSEPFNGSMVEVKIWSNDPAVSLAFTPTITTFSPEFRGLYYGADGVKGTADDVVRVSGSISEPINELYYIGAGVAYAANDQPAIDNIRSYVAGRGVFKIYCRASILRDDRSVVASFEKVVATSAPQGNILFSRGGIIQIRQPGDISAFVDASRDLKTWTLIAVAGNGDEVSAGDGTGLWFFRTRQ
jgi:hypothetical protein